MWVCVAFTQGRAGEPRYVPVDISTPHSCLTGQSHPRLVSSPSPLNLAFTGHKSIVNTALFHPHAPQVLTAGIERGVLLHSAVRLGGMRETPRGVRELPAGNEESEEEQRVRRRLLGGEVDERREAEDGDEGTIALFDECVHGFLGLSLFSTSLIRLLLGGA